MNKPRLRRPSAGVVLGTLALVVAVAGNTAAFSKTTVIVRKGQIGKGAVTAKTLAAGAVHPKALAGGAVTTGAIKADAVGATALGPDAVTSGAIRAGAVGAAALAPEAVTSGAIRAGAVGAGSLSPDAVTSGAIAPGSVYGGALGPVTVHSAPIKDEDASADLSTWTSSSTATALCAPGEHLLSGGVLFLNPGNRRVAIIASAPVVNGGSVGWSGQITSDSGGTATAEVQALCLK